MGAKKMELVEGTRRSEEKVAVETDLKDTQ